jgi:hypothetical protein
VAARAGARPRASVAIYSGARFRRVEWRMRPHEQHVPESKGRARTSPILGPNASYNAITSSGRFASASSARVPARRG